MNFAEQFEAIFGEKLKKEKYSFQAHSFTKRIVGKPYCNKCGLLALNNNFSRWAIKMGCNNKSHSGYKAERRKTSLVKTH